MARLGVHQFPSFGGGLLFWSRGFRVPTADGPKKIFGGKNEARTDAKDRNSYVTRRINQPLFYLVLPRTAH